MKNPTQGSQAEQVTLITILAQLHEWEIAHSEMLGCTTGRQLYFSFAQRSLVGGYSPSVKEIITAHHLTDRALRSRLQRLVRQGYFKVERNTTRDRRTRALVPSETLQAHMEEHLEMFKRLLNEQFMLIERGSDQQQTNAGSVPPPQTPEQP